MSELLTLIGEKLRLYREAKGLSQEQLSGMTGISRPRISNIECGKVNMKLETLENIMDALEIHPNDLFNISKLAGKTEIKEKQTLLYLHNSVLRERELDEIKYIVDITTKFLDTIDEKKKKK
ncbi:MULTISPECIES: helix-turn-helix domain-containing protein [Rummeliibacillus]|jgi:transcriptional regulator with XRE-family HTH domain|uniref:helix-turn-helix domain-containing protein n=1 Tax=Rummeliibacillus TaxID=648802 RepID=UPI0011B71F4F|nr:MULTISPECIES: helix-turn-helix transcriptional regulator [Rummeliibacillus]MBO2535912.1 helix-turn-helix transcriptional regulator [Rummeliibacillus suwonensis]